MPADAKEIFDSAKEKLISTYKSKFEGSETSKIASTMIGNLIAQDAWALLNELLQNSIDIKADLVKITIYSNGDLKYQHNADLEDFPLDEKSIEGLCGLGLSSKGLNSVGFMGVGFKFFTKFFEEVTVSDRKINFTISYRGNWKGRIKSLYSPKWNDVMVELDSDYTTAFYFKCVLDGKGDQISEIIDTVKLENFALLSIKGLNKLIIEKETKGDDDAKECKQIDCDTDGNEVTITEDAKVERFIAFSKKMVASSESRNIVIEKRKLEKDYYKDTKLRRTVSLILNIDKDGLIKKRKRRKQDPGNEGKLFCLVPLTKTKFPFKVSLDADWFMNTDRTSLTNDNYATIWHTEMISKTFPELIKEYLIFATEQPKNKISRAIDIFPEKYDPLELYPIWTEMEEFKFIFSDIFESELAKKLANCQFIRTTNGEFGTPNDVKSIVSRPISKVKKTIYSQTGHSRYIYQSQMEEKDFQDFVNTFSILILERDCIESRTVNYLSDSLRILSYPEESDYDIEKLRKLWDENNPESYLHILDIISKMIDDCEGGPKIIPLSNGDWGELFNRDYVFEKLPNNDNKEKILYEKILGEGHQIDHSIMVHENLKGVKEYSHLEYKEVGKYGSYIDYSGNSWKRKIVVLDDDSIEEEKRTLYGNSLKIGEIIKKFENQNKELLIAILNYSIRTDRPDLINYLISKDGTINPVESCFVPEKYGDNKIQPKEEFRILADSIIKIIEEGIEPDKIEDFLIKAGLIIYHPVKHTEENDNPVVVKDKTGLDVDNNKGAKYKSTRANWDETIKSLKNGWTIIDYKWPVDLEKIQQKSLWKFLSKPSNNLKDKMKCTLKQISFFYSGHKGPYDGIINSTWMEQLKSVEWVKCSDGNYRKPSESPLNNSVNKMSYYSSLDPDATQFYKTLGINFDSNMEQMSAEDCMKTWQKHPVEDVNLFIKKMNELDVALEQKITLLMETKWSTRGAYFNETKLKFFIQGNTSKLGGFIGASERLDRGILKELKKNGIIFKKKITLEMMMKCNNMIIRDIKNKKSSKKIDEILHKNWQMIIKNDFDLNEIEILNSDMESTKSNVSYYLSPVVDDTRFDLNGNELLKSQFPSDISFIRKLCVIKHPKIQLIDDTIELDFPISDLIPVIDISRILHSMGLKYKVFFCDEIHIVKRDNIQCKIPFLIRENNDEIVILLWKGEKWIDDLCSFLIDQGGEEFVSSHKRLRNCLECVNHNLGIFGGIYEEFCQLTKIKTFSEKEIIEKIGLKPQQNIKPKEETFVAKSKPAELRIANKRDEKIESNKVSNKKKTKNKQSKSRLRVDEVNNNNPNKKKSLFTDDQIGDIGEVTVAEKLTENGWDVKIMPKNNPGFDLLAEKDGIRRYIEVKSTRGFWDSVTMNHQQGLHYLKAVEKDGGRGEIEYWICVVENILNEKQTEISKEISPINAINLTYAKPDYTFNGAQWTNRIEPDEDFY